jgi:hypothetical protein
MLRAALPGRLPTFYPTSGSHSASDPLALTQWINVQVKNAEEHIPNKNPRQHGAAQLMVRDTEWALIHHTVKKRAVDLGFGLRAVLGPPRGGVHGTGRVWVISLTSR